MIDLEWPCSPGRSLIPRAVGCARTPIEWRESTVSMRKPTDTYSELQPALALAHYERCWGKVDRLETLERGPMPRLAPRFGVAVFAPREGRALWTYATMGMSSLSSGMLEAHMFSKCGSSEITEVLTMVAHFHMTASGLGLHHTVNFGRPWIGGSECDHGLLSLPYLDGPTLEEQDSPSGLVRHLWLIPITRSELSFKKSCGVEALEDRFELSQFDFADPGRAAVV